MRKIVLLCFLACSFQGLSQSYHLQHGINMYEAGSYDEAESLLQEEIKKHPQESKAYEFLGKVYEGKDSLQQAIKQFDLAIKFAAKTETKRLASLWKNKGIIYVKAEINEKALSCFEMALKLNTQDISVLLARSDLFYRMDRLKEAKQDCEVALKLDDLHYESIVQYIYVLYQLKEYDPALRMAQLLMKLKPGLDLPFSIRSKIYERQGQIALAIDDAYEAIRIEDSRSNQDQLINLAGYDFELSLNKADLLVQEFPRRDLMLNLRARIYQNNSQYEEAIADVTKAMQLVREDQESYYLSRRGYLYDAWGFRQLALNDYAESIKRDSSAASNYAMRGYQHMILGNYERALQDYNKGLALDPTDEILYHFRGLAHMYLAKNYKASLTDFNRSLAVNKSDVNTLLYRGRLYAHYLHEPNLAKTDFETIVSVDSALGETSTSKYHGLLGLGKKIEAISRLKEEVAKFQTASDHYNAACVYAILGQNKEAIAHLDTSIQKGNVDLDYIKFDPDLVSIRQDEGYIQLLANLSAKMMPVLKKELTRQASTFQGKYANRDFEIPFLPQKRGGTYDVKGSMNGLKLDMLYDTGASNISISQLEEEFMFKNGYLDESDFVGERSFSIADGSSMKSKLYIVRDFELGGVVIHNIEISVMPNRKAGILLGQSAMARFGKFEVDNQRNIIKFTTNINENGFATK
jgi:tetratricopeptide (TPR) repeat protein